MSYDDNAKNRIFFNPDIYYSSGSQTKIGKPSSSGVTKTKKKKANAFKVTYPKKKKKPSRFQVILRNKKE